MLLALLSRLRSLLDLIFLSLAPVSLALLLPVALLLKTDPVTALVRTLPPALLLPLALLLPSIFLLPLALLLGVLRMGGALTPCLLAHALNNAIATVLALTVGVSEETTGSVALLAGLCGLVALATALSCVRPAEPEPAVR